MTTVIGRVQGGYETQKVAFGTVYKWRPGHVLIECGCGERSMLTSSEATCERCGVDHAPRVREELSGLQPKDEAVRPWRYAEDRQEVGLPY